MDADDFATEELLPSRCVDCNARIAWGRRCGVCAREQEMRAALTGKDSVLSQKCCCGHSWIAHDPSQCSRCAGCHGFHAPDGPATSHWPACKGGAR